MREFSDQRQFSRDGLAADLRRLGVGPGDTLFVHSSFRSLGPLVGGVETVIAVLQDAVGDDGLLLMPSFNLIDGGAQARAAHWNLQTTEATTGWISERFRATPGTVRSDHYSHSVAARGGRAAEFVADHRRVDGMKSPWDLPPWGKTYGEHSPMIRAYHDPHGKLLMLGVDYQSSTYCHVAEAMDWNRRLQSDPNATYYFIRRDEIGAWWDRLGRLRRGRVAGAACRLFSIRDFVDTLVDAVARDPARWFESHTA